MYSLVLATMLTAGSATPAWGGMGCHGFSCHGSSSCHGCHGCGGYSNCYGCCGYSSCSGCYGNAGSCYGCYGNAGSCYGCYGNAGSCYGCYGNAGSCYGCYGNAGSCYGCYGYAGSCYGCYGYAGSCYGCSGSNAAPRTFFNGPSAPGAAPAVAPQGTKAPSSQEKDGEEMKYETKAPTRAKVIVKVPEDAELFIDDQPSQLTSGTRAFISPNLEAGEDYYYILKAKAVRYGKVVQSTKRVLVHAGTVAKIDFDDLGAAPQMAAQVTVRMPKDAKLFIDGQAMPLPKNGRVFTTPSLEPGRQYYYSLKAEVIRDGKPRTENQRVIVEAGKKVTVSFDQLATDERTANR